MTDRELLEMAAKAAGIAGKYVKNEPIQGAYRTGIWDDLPEVCWNPLDDDGDALRLAVKLGICIGPNFDKDRAVAYGDDGRNIVEEYLTDPTAATRRAIVRAAAQIGRTM